MPIPSVPSAFCPQHMTLPWLVNAQENAPPPTTDIASAIPETSTGVVEHGDVVPDKTQWFGPVDLAGSELSVPARAPARDVSAAF